MERRQFLTATAAVGLAALDLTDAQAVTRRVKRPGRIHVGMGEVDAVHSMTTALGDAASELGGGHARHLAVRYLIDDVKPWLDGACTEKDGRELFAATSQLLQLIGGMARDAGAQSLTQRYHVHSFKLAAEAGENELAATALRGLADQAIDLSHIPTAIRPNEACEQRGRKLANPKALARRPAGPACPTAGQRRSSRSPRGCWPTHSPASRTSRRWKASLCTGSDTPR
ncbi:hypothetical protein [Streptomyces sp. NPDC001250]|uniref:hypothetical protein n=1 Tax=unclassified Streptomyces TaxID=2593676 RepID=UPI003320F5EE